MPQALRSLCLSLCQMEAVPPSAQGRVSNGLVNLSLGAENQHAGLRGSNRYAAPGSRRRRDGYC